MDELLTHSKNVIEAQFNKKRQSDRYNDRILWVRKGLAERGSEIASEINVGKAFAINAGLNPASSYFIVVTPRYVEKQKTGVLVKPDLDIPILFKDVYEK